MSAYRLNKQVILCFTSFLFASNCEAVSIDILQEQCADIGFKIKTPSNGECVLRLMKSVANQKTREESERKAYEAKVAAENAQRQQEVSLRQQEAYLRRQQSEMLELQRQSIESQENIASEQRRSAGLQLMQKGLESLSGGGQRLKTTCRNAGIGIVTCN